MNHIFENRKVPQALIDQIQTHLRYTINQVSGINFIMVCSSDGFEITSVHKKLPQNTGKLAAVSSSILAMVNAFLTEIHLQGCQNITLDAENGKAILTSIPHKEHPLVLVVLTSTDVLLGQLIYEIKKTKEYILNLN